MFAVYASAPHADDPMAGLTIGERPEPSVPEGWVRVDVRAASLNMHDVWTLRGVGIAAESFPMILGCDGAGVLADGTEVLIHPVINAPGWRGDETLDPRRTLLTERHQGTFADSVVVPAGNVIPKPPELSFAVAATLGTAWLTAYRMLFVQAGVRPGQTVLVQGASGGVSTALIQLASAAGARVWVTGRTEEKRALATGLGAHATFEAGARLPERVDAVFETVGKATWSHSLKSLKPGGTVVVAGATSGPDPSADLQRVFFLQLRVLGSTMGTRQELVDLVSFLRLHDIRPQIGLTLPLEQATDGFRAMLDGETTGKIVFTR
ncbi:NADPH:quinone reductase-like Zn-dependent oxidoreductase [Actinoalloteichus hoggarensis]|uniref:Alcohol dehydrogenase n=1 Tax=Actinoalloteichus hoggarensis TaxID=1470176 RepID=A0A221W829_9PSEU|nr:zinc-binding dehydrogenase [Actinoalloteichus hoggarensis]ASO22132.1 Alcohol dehydrogenase [Actinoalloteichus hoggarensis]MBB5923787.1 NADPH:quinone reductase-like Zn-dependent oxidoreductase [Actinoalloteichus hoggarensis]